MFHEKIKGPEFSLVRLRLRGTIFQQYPICLCKTVLPRQLAQKLFCLLSICLTSYLSNTGIGFSSFKNIFYAKPVLPNTSILTVTYTSKFKYVHN